MSDLRFTPGPWDTRDDDKRITVGVGLVEGPNGYDVAEVYNDDCDRDEAWANARLIAAAPELLSACVHAAAQFRYYEKLHSEKGTPDGDEKAHRNAEMAERCEAAIVLATTPGAQS